MKKIKTEIIVAGGGTAGCAAAIAAARMGNKVILIEKMTICGGLATAGNILMYLPLCDAHGTQVIRGISEEFILDSIKYGPGEINDDWKDGKGRYMVNFNPASFVLALDELLKDAGVEVWFDTVVTNTIKDEDKLVAIECYNKSGMHKIEADCFIDATGDADIAFSAGCDYNVGMNNISCWTLDVPLKKNNEMHLYAGGDCITKDDAMEGISGKMISEYTFLSREKLLKHYQEKWNRDDNSNPKNTYPVTLPTVPNVRKTRAIIGLSNLNENNFWTEFPDTVGVFPATIDFWKDNSKVWEIPYGSLVPKKLDNLLIAGRCIDSRNYAWENTRLIPVTAQTGEITGIAASLSLKLNQSIHKLNIMKLQEELSNQNLFINFKEVYGSNWKQISQERLKKQKTKERKNENENEN